MNQESRNAGNLDTGRSMPESVRIEHLENTSKSYYELLFAVESKWPNESRHETALRYIKQAEHRDQSDVPQMEGRKAGK